MKKVFFLIILSLSLLVARSAQCATLIDRVVAIVGDDVITLSELQSEMAPALAELNQRYRGEELASATDALRKSTLNNLIDKYLQIQEARLQGVEVTEQEVNDAVEDIMKKNKMDKAAFVTALENEGYTLDDYRKSLSDQLAILRLVTRAVKSRITIKDDEITEYYNKNASKFTEPESVRVANIFFPAKADGMEKALGNAQAARAEILAGAPFEEMAARCTGDPEAAKTCVLGTFGRGELSSAIEEKAFSMKSGEVSEPIAADNGYQLIKVMERTSPGVKPIDEVRGRIVEDLSAQKGETLFASWIQEIRKRTYVEVREY